MGPKPRPKPKPPKRFQIGGKPKTPRKKKKFLTDEEKIARWEKEMEILEVKLEEETNIINEKRPIALEHVHAYLDDKTFPRVYKDMKHKWHLFKYCSDLKDMYICKLKDDELLLEEQRKIMKHMEMEQIDRMIKNFFQTIETGIEEYKHKRDKLIKDRYCFINYNLKEAQKDLDYINAIKHILSVEYKNELNELNGEQLYERHDQEREYLIEDETLNRKTIDDLEAIWCQIKKIYKNYIAHTKKKRKAFTVLQTKDQEDDATIERLRDSIATLHIEKDRIVKEMKKHHVKRSKILDLESEKSTFLDTLMKMRANLKQDYVDDANMLSHLTKLCNEVVVELKDVEILVEKILKYINLCNKYETLHEKVQPYSVLIESIDIAFNEEFPEYKDLDKFLYRMAQAEIHVDYMEELLNKYQAQEVTLKSLVKDAVESYGK